MATRQKKPLSANNFQVQLTIQGQSSTAYWSKCSEIKKEYDAGTYSDGQSNIKYKLPGAVSYPDVTLSKTLQETDTALMTLLLKANQMSQGNSNEYITVDIQPVYRDGLATSNIGSVIHLMYCTVMSVAFSAIDTQGSDPATVTLVVSPGYIQSNDWWVEPGANSTTTASQNLTGSNTTA